MHTGLQREKRASRDNPSGHDRMFLTLARTRRLSRSARLARRASQAREPELALSGIAKT
jgi:hypothetical protein